MTSKEQYGPHVATRHAHFPARHQDQTDIEYQTDVALR